MPATHEAFTAVLSGLMLSTTVAAQSTRIAFYEMPNRAAAKERANGWRFLFSIKIRELKSS